MAEDGWEGYREIQRQRFEEKKRFAEYFPNVANEDKNIAYLKGRVLKLEAQIAKMTLHINNLERSLNVKYEPEPEEPFTLPKG